MSQGNWHVNPETGNPGRCKVDWSNPKSRGCPHGLSQGEHFSTAADASRSYSESQEANHDVFAGATTSAQDQLRNLRTVSKSAPLQEESQYISKDIGEQSFWGRNGKKIGGAVVATFAISAAGSLIFGNSASTEADGIAPQGDSSVIREYKQPVDENDLQSEETNSQASETEELSTDEDATTDDQLSEPVDDPNTQDTRDTAKDYGSEVGEKLRQTGKQLKDEVTPERVEKVKDFGKSTKDFLSGVIDGVSGHGPTVSVPVDIPENNASSEGVIFQGKGLQPSSQEVRDAQATLKSLEVRPENKGAYYDRAEQFGRSFQTGVVGKLEHRDLPEAVFKNSAPQSRAIGGGFTDPYTGEHVEVVKGSSNDTNVDHIVPLHEVVKSEKVEDPLTSAERISIANDFDNLQVVGASINKTKGDKDPGKWLPPNSSSHQRYAIATINVKAKYGLTVDGAEYSALAEVLANRQ